MRAVAVLGLCAVCLVAGCVGPLAPDGAVTTYNGTVVGVVDGDTIDVRLEDGREERVRLLGIDTPEIHATPSPSEYPGVPNTTAGRACLRSVGENASAFVRERVAARSVRLEIDPAADRRGGYDRLLAYVFMNETNLNRDLVALGYARVFETTFSLRDDFEAAESTAMTENRGVWRCRT